MTRVCVDCGEKLGEKCVRCGAESVPLDPNAQGHPAARIEFRCPACGHQFTQGEGGETGGMCEQCFDAALRIAHERQKTGRH